MIPLYGIYRNDNGETFTMLNKLPEGYEWVGPPKYDRGMRAIRRIGNAQQENG